MKVKKITEKIMNVLFLICGLTAIAFVALISIYMIISGLPAIMEIGLFDFLFGTVWDPANSTNPQYGIWPIMLSSIYATGGAILLGIPIGVLTAVFLSKYAGSLAASLVKPAVELLSGIPSVVYGLVGVMFLVPAIADLFNLPKGSGLLAAIIVLMIMVLPSIISISETALNAVPREYEEASLALGASHTETVFKVTIPAAKNGIAAGIVLGIGRAIGEAMAIMMVAGNVANMPKLFESVALLTTSIAKDMGYASGLHRDALFSIGLVLFVFILIINAVMNVLIKSGGKDR